jgi:asparagine synthase (glutamine-hydrolysing)
MTRLKSTPTTSTKPMRVISLGALLVGTTTLTTRRSSRCVYGAHPKVVITEGVRVRLKEIGREILPAALLDRLRGYFPVPALRHPDEQYLTMLRVALYPPPKAKELELLQPQSVEILRSRPNDHRTRTGANSFWVLRVLDMYLQAHGVS